jgi:amidohydrolase
LDIDKLKAAVIADINAHIEPLGELSRKIHDNPEVAFHEAKAADWLATYLAENGFQVERSICQLPTAFRGSYGKGETVTAIMAEYDALPEVGHACGHNLIAISAVAAGIAAKRAVDELGGQIIVFGTPGEELYGGKAIMAERGAFTDVDVAMMVHPGTSDITDIQTLACQTLDVEFFGQAAHAAASPEEGISALEALIQSFNTINSLRQMMRSTDRINGIITDGGKAANIIPDHTAASFIVRAETNDYLEDLMGKVINCFKGAAEATGAKLEFKYGERYESMFNNIPLARAFRDNLNSLGHNIHSEETNTSTFSTDMGNVSQLVPAIHPLIAIAQCDTFLHSPQFARVAVTEPAFKSMLDAAKAMAMTIVDILADQNLLSKIQAEFRRGWQAGRKD